MAKVTLAASPDRLTYYATRKTAREALPGFGIYVILWSFLAAFGAALAGSSVGLFAVYVWADYNLGTYPTLPEFNLFTQYFSLAFFGLFLVVFLVKRIAMWEDLVRDFEEQEYQPREQMQSVIRPMPKPQEHASNSYQAMRPGTYPKTQREMSELYNVFIDNEWKFVRDVLALARMPDGTENGRPIFTNLTANWDGIKHDWERAGFAADGYVTEAGQEWVESQCMPGTVQR